MASSPVGPNFFHLRWPRRAAKIGVAVSFTALLSATGCNRPGNVEVDLTSTPARFVINHSGWPRPFWWPRVTEFAIGSEEDGLVWHLQATNHVGELAHRLAFVYGEAPPGFEQVVPPSGKAPKQLVSGRSYFVGATGPSAVYRMAFALPISSEEAARRRLNQPVAPETDRLAPEPTTTKPSRISPAPPPRATP